MVAGIGCASGGTIAAFAVALGSLAGCGRPFPHDGSKKAGPVTFTKHVAPILFRECAFCHRPGEAAPFSVLSYQEVRRRASRIVDVTGRRYMPPWLPAHG